MADNVKDVELRIRAKDYSQKDLKALVKTIDSLTAAMAEQQDAAKKGEASSKQLADSYKRMEQAANALLKQSSLIDTFRQQAKAVDTAAQKTEVAQRAYAQLATTMATLEAPTKRQTADLAKLERTVANLTVSEARAENTWRNTGTTLKALGVDLNNVSASEQKIAAASRTASAALKEQETAILGLDSAQKRLAASQAEAAAQERIRSQQAQAAASTYASFWVTALNAKESAEKRAAADTALEQSVQAQRQALQQAANQAIATANGYRTLATTFRDAASGANPLAASLRQIVDPAGQARTNLNGLEAQVRELATSISGIRGPVENLKTSMQQLDAAQRSAGGLAQMIDGYSRQLQVLQQARQQYSAARQSVLELAQQVRTAVAPNNELNASLAAAQARLKSASTEMQNVVNATRQMRAGLQQAGINTKNLQGEAARLTTTVKQTVTATNDLSAAVKRYGVSAKEADTNTRAFGSGARQSLSYVQRLRGEVLGMATAFIGIQSAVKLANDSLEAYRSKLAIQTRLSVLVGNDAKAIGNEWNYLQGQAERLGFGFEQMAMSYSKFAIAAKMSGSTLQEARFIFEGFAEAARASKMSTDDFDGSLKAVEQMLSKGSIQAEELRQQLGDRLPGAFQLAARAANMSVAEFTKAMANGQISSDFVINIARELKTVYKDILPTAVDTMIAAEGRLQTAYYNFRLSIAESGLVEAYSQFVAKLTNVLKGDQGAQLASQLSSLFSSVVSLLGFIADHADVAKTALMAMVGVQVLMQFSGLVTAIGNLWTALETLYTVIVTATVAMVNFRTTLATIAASSFIVWIRNAIAAMTAATAAATGLSAATAAIVWPVALATALAGAIYYLVTAFQKGRQEALDFAGALDVSADALRRMTGAQRTAALDKLGDAAEEGRRQLKDLTSEVYDLDKSLKDLQKRDNGGAGMKSSIDALQRRYNERRAQLDAAEQDLRKTEAKQKALQEAQKGQFPTTPGVAGTADPGTGGSQGNILGSALEKELAKARTRADKKLHQQSLTDAKRNWEERKSLIVDEYKTQQDMIDNLAKTQPEKAKKLNETLQGIINDRVKAEEMAYNREEAKIGAKEAAKGQRRVELAREVATQISAIEDDLANRNAKVDGTVSFAERRAAAIQAVSNSYDALYTKILKLGGAEGAQAKSQLDALVKQRQEIEGLKQDTQEMARLQDVLNERIKTRTALLDVIEKRRSAGTIGAGDAIEQTKGVMAQTGPGINEAADAVTKFATSLKTITPDQLIQIKAEMEGIKLSTIDSTNAMANFAKAAVDSLVGNAQTAFSSMAASIGDFITGIQSGKDAINSLWAATKQFFASFMADIAQAIIKQLLLNAIQSSGKAMGGTWGTAISGAAAAVNHSGGMAGGFHGRHRAGDH
ncbi:tape measure protein [Pectobacterium phage MA12]|uniref:Tape measure protein n=1 Tax=Pectobacterium phage MA12 TaxID=2686474 RepID=A0A6B9RQ43_9CAUD|nr:tail length tape measure protein [Pectobacterium phage MA12]QHI00865.1 tape measure protein [Pectobacterium phage MA12]